VAVASAKIQACRTASVAARLGHQVHGAIGLTQEHDLRLSTMRLLAWRDEYGNEDFWSTEIGTLLLEDPRASAWGLISAAVGV
jgi:acyl-CoA dehydrogenase